MDDRPLALIVDHDADTLELYASYFELEAWRTERAQDGASALVKAIERHPDVVVTEMWLPIVDGLRMVEILKADPSTTDIPIVALMAAAREAELRRARAAGCSLVLTKPCLPEVLLREATELRRGCEAHGGSAAKKGAEPGIERETETDRRLDAVRRRHRMASVRTVEPPESPPALHCPVCGTSLTYDCSYVGGVSRLREQWDYMKCPRGCGGFQYRHRTRKLRAL